MSQVVMPIEGMSCQGCVGTVTKVLTRAPGVITVEVSLHPGQATLEIDEAQVSVEQLAELVRDAGYDVPV